MKIQVNFKTPDALDYAMEDVKSPEKEKIRSIAEQWIKYSEYCTIEIDTEANTATVLKA